MHFKSYSILANLWCASLRGLGRRPSPGLLQCIKTAQMVGPRRHVFAIALTARASGERQTRNDVPPVLHADLRSRQVASIRPKGNADAVTHAASGQSGLETCALVTFRCKTDITGCAEMEVRADASLSLVLIGAARLIHPAMHDGQISRIRRERALFAQPKPHLQLLQSKLALSGTSGLISVAG